MISKRSTILDRRGGENRRIAYNPDHFLKGGVERRKWNERRSPDERRMGWLRVSDWSSIPISMITKNSRVFT